MWNFIAIIIPIVCYIYLWRSNYKLYNKYLDLKGEYNNKDKLIKELEYEKHAIIEAWNDYEPTIKTILISKYNFLYDLYYREIATHIYYSGRKTVYLIKKEENSERLKQIDELIAKNQSNV